MGEAVAEVAVEFVLPVTVGITTAALFTDVGAGFESGFDSAGFKKNSVSLPSMRLMNTRNDLLSGPTAIRSGVP